MNLRYLSYMTYDLGPELCEKMMASRSSVVSWKETVVLDDQAVE